RRHTRFSRDWSSDVCSSDLTGSLMGLRQLIIAIILMMIVPVTASAQYFGQNKMRYKKLKFDVRETPHFEMYSYLKNDSMLTWLRSEERRVGKEQIDIIKNKY